MTHADWRADLYSDDAVHDIWDQEHAGHYLSMALRSWPIDTIPNPTEPDSDLDQTTASDDTRCRLDRVDGNAEAALW